MIGSLPTAASCRPYAAPTDGSSNPAARCFSQSPSAGTESWLRKTTSSPRACTQARFEAAASVVGETVSPYSMTITGGWAASDKITGVPNHLILTITSGDIRTVPGLTVQVRSVSGQWFLLSATPHAVMDGNDAFFPDT